MMDTKLGYIWTFIIITAFLFFFSASTLNAQSKNTWKAPKIADKLKNPHKGQFSDTKKGKELYNISCVTCHGESGKGDGIAAAGLVPKPADLTSKSVINQSDGAIYWKLTKGKSGTSMTGYKSSLSSKERWQLVNYIRELQPHKAKIKKSKAKKVKLKKSKTKKVEVKKSKAKKVELKKK